MMPLLPSLLALSAGLLQTPQLPDPPDPMRLELRGPIDKWDEAIPLGNGFMGGLLWGEGDELRLSLDRGGLWDNRPHPLTQQKNWTYAQMRAWVAAGRQDLLTQAFDACYDTNTYPSKIPGGRLVIDLPTGVTLGDFALDLRRAEGQVLLGPSQTARFLFSATSPVAMASLPLTGTTVHFERPPSLQKLGFPEARFGEEGALSWMAQDTVADGSYAVVVGKREIAGQTELAIAITSSQDGPDPLALGKQRVHAALEASYANMAAPHIAWWQDFWARSSVTLPDASLQLHYNLVKYFYGAASRHQAPPMPLQGVWTADTGGLPPWKGDYHHDLNTQATYIAYATAGCFEEGLSFLDYNLALLPQYRQFAQDFYGLSKGAVVPGVADFKGQPLGGWGMYSLSPTHGAWIAQIFYRHWKMTADPQFLREKAWPFTWDIATALLALCEEDEQGHLRLPLSSSPEIYDNSLRAWLTPNSNYDLSMLRAAFDMAAELAQELGETEQAASFQRASAKLEPWHVDEGGVLMFAAGEPFHQSHRHHAQLMAIHPFSQLTIEDGPEARRIIDASLNEVERLGTRAWVGYSFSWYSCLASRAGRADTALHYLKQYQWCTLRNGFHANGQQRGAEDISAFKYRPFTLEGNFLAMEAMQQMLLQSWRGTVRLFPSTPTSWPEASFRDLRAEGGFRVSAVRHEGQTQSLRIEASVDGMLRLRDPFSGAAADWSLSPQQDGDDWLLPMRVGQVLTATRRN